ncbi:LPXTG cell wall anchor domain-containing protein [Streptomyces sp. NPDC018693]|uniref:LPXTG cell wall anchor domain-containing protein n=1 Tax=unclassified Streptomyces TaxID=2593676 RepID=UPI0037ABEEBD
MRTLTRVGVAVAASSAALLLAPVAHATDTTTVQLRQELPLTAEGFEHGTCPGIAEDMDGWHFVLPADGKTKPDFVKLTVTFAPGGEQVVTDFSGFAGAAGKHAYVASEPGAELTSAVAEVTGGVSEEYLFNLSHTCPATDDKTPGDDDTSTPTDGSTPTDDSKPTDGSTPGDDDAVSPSASESAAAAPTSAPSAQGTSGDLAETGNGAPVAVLSAVAAALVGAGGFLLLRRRKAQQG